MVSRVTLPNSRPSCAKCWGEDMTVSPKSIDAITLFVEDLEQSKLFYQDVFGLPVLFEDENSAVFRFEITLINLLKIFLDTSARR